MFHNMNLNMKQNILSLNQRRKNPPVLQKRESPLGIFHMVLISESAKTRRDEGGVNCQNLCQLNINLPSADNFRRLFAKPLVRSLARYLNLHCGEIQAWKPIHCLTWVGLTSILLQSTMMGELSCF